MTNHITASRSLPLDPRRVYRLAEPSDWSVEERRIDLKAALDFLASEAIPHSIDDTPYTRHLSARLAGAEWALAAGDRKLAEVLGAARPGQDIDYTELRTAANRREAYRDACRDELAAAQGAATRALTDEEATGLRAACAIEDVDIYADEEVDGLGFDLLAA